MLTYVNDIYCWLLWYICILRQSCLDLLCSKEEVLRDSANMVPDCERRLQDSWDELNKLLVLYCLSSSILCE